MYTTIPSNPLRLAVAALLPFARTVSASASALSTCHSIAQNISTASNLIYPLSLDFESDIHHWFDSSTQTPACVLEVGSASDVANAMRLIASNKTPFAIKSGGHASNPGFSSTKGVHMTFNNMKQVTLSSDNSSVEIGMGLTWSDVYKDLQPSGVNVVGGRTVGPGVGGFTLGGGFSWKTNQYGLTCDNVKAYNIVLPNGTITQIDSSQPDLFFALKGGLNRFGVVTSAEYYTHPQVPEVYAGIAVYGSETTSAVINATREFYAQNNDPRAQIITTIEYGLGGPSPLVLFFYDGATRPASFAPFDNITATISDVQTQTFSSFVSAIPATIQQNVRGTFHTLSTSSLTQNFLDAVVNQTTFYGEQMALHGGTTVSYDIEPFLASYGQHATDSAYPHSDSPLPLNLYYAWLTEDQDAFWYDAMKASVEYLTQVAIQEGIYRSDFTAYPNYAISGTSAQDLYGSTNAARLASIRNSVDPSSIMEQAGGFTL